MKILKRKYVLNLIIFNLLLSVLLSNPLIADQFPIKINGNNYTDESVIISLIKKMPSDLSDEYSNYLIKTLDKSQLFEDVLVEIVDKKYVVTVKEYPSIRKINYNNNERLKNEDLDKLSNDMNLTNLNPYTINQFISETKKIYESFGYNNIQITYEENIDSSINTADLTFNFIEGKITKINKIYFTGNENIDSRVLKNSIKSKTKTLRNIFANNNYKKFIIENDIFEISKIYRNKGYRNINVNYKIEYLSTNQVNIYFNIFEGEKYYFSSIDILDNENIINSKLKEDINKQIISFINKNKIYSFKNIENLQKIISDLIISNSIDFFEIKSLEKLNKNKVDVLFQINSIEPKYANNINIYGNSRTYDYVIRRELSLIEGDAIHNTEVKAIEKKLKSLNLFKSVSILEKELEDNLVDIDITVEEKQTGTVNAGVSVGTIDGFAVVAGLSERNFYGTGRSVKTIINTSTDRNQFTLETTDRLLYENDVDINYNANYIEQDFSKASSYKLNTFSLGIGLSYNLNQNTRHFVDLDYLIKDYTVTNSSTVSSTIGSSQGENVSFLLINNLFYNTLNSVYMPQNGRSINYSNIVETPTSSSNGYIKNIFTIKNYKKLNKNILSNQTRIGNIISLANNDVLTDDKFSLGGRWLRGFDTYGAGPRNSRTSYVGGRNLFVTKFDYSRQITDSNDFPLFLNLFNDYGLVWDNKTEPTNSDSSLRSSVGFGIKYYSPIGPIGFSWGFPISDETYDINRMFLFSVGNID